MGSRDATRRAKPSTDKPTHPDLPRSARKNGEAIGRNVRRAVPGSHAQPGPDRREEVSPWPSSAVLRSLATSDFTRVNHAVKQIAYKMSPREGLPIQDAAKDERWPDSPPSGIPSDRESLNFRVRSCPQGAGYGVERTRFPLAGLYLAGYTAGDEK